MLKNQYCVIYLKQALFNNDTERTESGQSNQYKGNQLCASILTYPTDLYSYKEI